MTKLISVLIVVAVLFVGWTLWKYWETKKSEEENGPAKVATALKGEQLEGMPYQLGPSLAEAQSKGPDVFRKWLKTYGPMLKDPRKAWIEMDFCLAIIRDDPSEARRILADVKARTGPTSPVWPRVKELDKAFGNK